MLDQITDAITQTNVKVVGESPAMATALSYISAAHATGIQYHNAVNNQNNQFVSAQAASIQGIVKQSRQDTMNNVKSFFEIVKTRRTN